MSTPLLSFQQFVQSQQSAMQASSTITLDFSVGSFFLALIESNASAVGLWLQALAVEINAGTRLTTSQGVQVDTFIQDFSLTRLPAINATGSVTFSRLSPVVQAVIPVVALVSSTVTQISYSVTVDTTNMYWTPSQNAYVVPVDVSSITVPVIALTAGSIGNALAGQINTIDSVIIGMDSVTNGSPFTSGADQETDAQVKVRFALYINSLSRAVYDAIAFAIQSVSGVTRYNIVPLLNTSNQEMVGYFYVVADDGSGDPPDSLLANVSAAVNGYRACGIAFSVYGPSVLDVTLVLTITIADVTTETAVVTNVQNAFLNYFAAAPFEAFFPYSFIPDIAYSADARVLNVTSYTINSGTSDIQLNPNQVFSLILSNLTVNVNVL